MGFRLVSEYGPRGDQGQAIERLVASIRAGNRHQTLLGVTGSGKTFTVANVIAELGRPALVMSHNKTLAAQLYSELKRFFPENAVEYFVSYFDYYQPEAYLPATDTYIEKDSSINDEIERLRLSAVGSLLTRRDVVVVASVSCIYGLASPEDFGEMVMRVGVGEVLSRERFLYRLVTMLYEREDRELMRGKFRVRGDVVEVYPSQEEGRALRFEFFGDEVERIRWIDVMSGRVLGELREVVLFPAKQFVTPREKLVRAIRAIEEELEERVKWFEERGKLVEAQRIRMRTEHDLELLRELGYCPGVENYSRHLSGREAGSRPYTLMDFLPEDVLVVIDESHVTVPQIGGMYAGDRSRKQTLVDYGFRLPSALDNRPLNFREFMESARQFLYVSATPGEFELVNSFVGNEGYVLPAEGGLRESAAGWVFSEGEREFDPRRPGARLVVEQIIRPTGLLDPEIEIRPLEGQIDATIELCRERAGEGERVLVITLTKRTAEDLADYLRGVGLRVQYLHSDIDTIERVEILRDLRAGKFDVLVGINLLREGLDLPEVSLVCILDADKEGYLRSQTSLIQMAGRAARNVNGRVVLFADERTKSIEALVRVTEYRREKQMEYNRLHGITPQSVVRAEQESLHIGGGDGGWEEATVAEEGGAYGAGDVEAIIAELESEMAEAARRLEYERAALLRDQIRELRAGRSVVGEGMRGAGLTAQGRAGARQRRGFSRKRKV